MRFKPSQDHQDTSLHRAEKDAGEKNAVITVADTGTGIEENNLQKILTRFSPQKMRKMVQVSAWQLFTVLLKNRTGQSR